MRLVVLAIVCVSSTAHARPDLAFGLDLGVVVAGYGFGDEDDRNVQPPPVLVRLWLVTRTRKD